MLARNIALEVLQRFQFITENEIEVSSLSVAVVFKPSEIYGFPFLNDLFSLRFSRELKLGDRIVSFADNFSKTWILKI